MGGAHLEMKLVAALSVSLSLFSVSLIRTYVRLLMPVANFEINMHVHK